MKEKNFCRCCLSEECYKDMTNDYYIGKRTENYFEMLLNIFNINITHDDAQRCLICEECVSKLRDAAAFKKKVLDVQEVIRNNFCWENNDTKTENVEVADYFDDFDDNVSDSDFLWENFTQDSPKKGQVFVISLETGKTQPQKSINNYKNTKPYEITIDHDKSIVENRTILDFKAKGDVENPSLLDRRSNNENLSIPHQRGEENDKNLAILEQKDEDGIVADDMNTEDFDIEEDCELVETSKKNTKRSPVKKIVKTKTVTAKQNKDKLNKTKTKRREISQIELGLQHKSENTLKLVQNSNLCLFRSLRNKFGCSFCPSKFPEFSELREHSLTHKNPKMSALKRLRGLSCKNAEISDLKCNLCSENCTDLQELTAHLKTKHEISFRGTEHYLVPYKLKDGFQCVFCELKFNTFFRLSIHMNSHYTNNVCEICGLSFINRLSLRTHFQMQHKEKKCARCPAIFFKNSQRSKHMIQAHGLKNTKKTYCNLCNETFKYTYMLNEHKIEKHGVKRQISSCEECGKTFFSPLNLKTHIRSVHIRERNYPCTKCGMRFFTKCDQKRHERTHEDVRSFCCSYCDAKFKSKDSWRRHLKRQHGHVFGEDNTVFLAR